jgi:hypothetical protein
VTSAVNGWCDRGKIAGAQDRTAVTAVFGYYFFLQLFGRIIHEYD